MFQLIPALNIVGIVGATVVAMIIGALWYSDMLFGMAWAKASARDAKEAKKKMAEMKNGMGLGVVAALLTAVGLNVLLSYSGVGTFGDGLMVAFWTWLGVVAAREIGGVGYEGRPWMLAYVNGGYAFVQLMAMAAVLVMVH